MKAENQLYYGYLEEVIEADLLKSNIVSGRQIRCARTLAGLTQAELARAAGLHPRSIRYHERKGDAPPTCVESTLNAIEHALAEKGVIVFREPTPGVRLR